MPAEKISSTPYPFRTSLRIESVPRSDSSLFLPGEVLEGRVLEKIDDRHVVIQLKEHAFRVESRIPLPEGFEGNFRVDAVSPQVILRVMGEKSIATPESWPDLFVRAFAERVSGLLGEAEGPLPAEIRDAVGKIAALFNEISPDAGWIKKALSQSGLFFEAKLRELVDLRRNEGSAQMIEGDLKGLLLKLKSHLEAFLAQDGISPEVLSDSEDRLEKLDQVLRKIEAYQVLNLRLSEDADKHFILLPLWYQGSLRFAEGALLRPRPSDESGSESLSLLFLLDLPALGEMSIEVKIVHKEILCRFNVADPASCLLMREVLPALHDRLTQIGFQPRLSIEEEPPEKILPLLLLTETGEGMRSLFNVIV